jgi:hypothetical protein
MLKYQKQKNKKNELNFKNSANFSQLTKTSDFLKHCLLKKIQRDLKVDI